MSKFEVESATPLDHFPEISTDDNCYDVFRYDAIFTTLTKRQREVAVLLGEGYNRKEIAGKLHTGIQAIYQIIIRIRYRLVRKAEVKPNAKYK
jgi:DNA-binding NarL/FixJ family response regulator